MPIHAKNCYTKTNGKFRHPATVVLITTVKSGILQENKSAIDVMLIVMKREETHLNQYW